MIKDKAKAKKYEEEIAKLSQDYEQTREKDASAFDKVSIWTANGNRK